MPWAMFASMFNRNFNKFWLASQYFTKQILKSAPAIKPSSVYDLKNKTKQNKINVSYFGVK